jgi:hypothetical protein
MADTPPNEFMIIDHIRHAKQFQGLGIGIRALNFSLVPI